MVCRTPRESGTLLFLPGWVSDHTQVDPTARLSAEHRRVLVLDWPGHGRSEKPSANFGYDEMVEGAPTTVTEQERQRIPQMTYFWTYFDELLRTLQAVEKVVVGPVGGPQKAPDKAKTLRKRRFLSP
jgi:pimeloyl-ACP methyl ester carboxylesterase